VHVLGADEHPRRLLELAVRGEGHPERAEVVGAGGAERCDICRVSVKGCGGHRPRFLTKRVRTRLTMPPGDVKPRPRPQGPAGPRIAARAAAPRPRPPGGRRTSERRRVTLPRAIQPGPTRIQQRNRETILAAALEAFSAEGFAGATLDGIARAAGLSKPNVLYYFPSKAAIHVALLEGLLDSWLDPLRAIDPGRRAAGGDPDLCPAQARHEPRLCRAKAGSSPTRSCAGRTDLSGASGRAAEAAGRRQGRG
jgi:AcrR family transcriptional regulator